MEQIKLCGCHKAGIEVRRQLVELDGVWTLLGSAWSDPLESLSLGVKEDASMLLKR